MAEELVSMSSRELDRVSIIRRVLEERVLLRWQGPELLRASASIFRRLRPSRAPPRWRHSAPRPQRTPSRGC